MIWLERCLAQLVSTRGAAAVWEIACAAALAPLLAVFAFNSELPANSTLALAVALAFSITMLVGLRGAIAIADPLLAKPRADTDSTLVPSPAAEVNSVTGLLARDHISRAVAVHDLASGRALLGLIRFANHAAMTAYQPAAARRVMQEFARRLEAASGPARVIAQLDEDLFAVFFSDRNAAQSAEDELKSIAAVLAHEIVDTHMTVAPDIHAGCAWLVSPSDTFAGVFAAAQASLVPLKRLGQSKARAGAQPASALAERFALEQALRGAVREGQLSLRYQPFFDANAGRIAGAEALLRWRHPQFGDVPPTRFVPLLEETGLVHEIGLWTLNTACRQLHTWRSRQHDLRLAVNLSAIQLQNRSLRSLIERTVSAHGLSPTDIELELTETAAMEDEVRTINLFHELRDQGFGIAIDDFGSGHSNLSYLKNLPFTKLKIDREFVTHVDSRTGSQAICKAMVELGAGLGISVLAEGVERFEEVNTLRRLGCHTFQGFYFSHPLTADEFSAGLENADWLQLVASDVHRSRAELQKRIAL
jgi:EAL domain-containing protein (putative c-di-GMP-specific phosphodiesterase class I)/GGDEF domain-containing protein